MNPLDLVTYPVAWVLRTIHSGLSTFLDPASGWAWGLSIVLLTVTVRLVLFPLFVKQIKSQRRMQQLAPMVKELQKKHKGDRETLNVETMKLYKDNNANPIMGCLPLLVQMPVFFALFSVLREFRPGAEPQYGLSQEQLTEGGLAKIFGAPISAAFNSPQSLLDTLNGEQVTVRVVAAIMVVLMGASTYWTQRQMMARAGAATDPMQQQIQKILLYVLPFSFAISGFFFPVGVLLYWLTTNVWSMGQQAFIIKRMPPPVVGGTPPGAVSLGKGSAGSGSGSGKGGSGKGGSASGEGSGTGSARIDASGPAGTPSASGSVDLAKSSAPTATTRQSVVRPAGAAPKRASGSRKNKRRRGGR